MSSPLAACLLALAARGQGTAPQGAPAGRPPAVRTMEPEFNALMLRYGAATRDYEERRVRLARARSGEPDPPHPARAFLADFQALAAKDSGGAQGWILENLRFALDDPAERARIANEVFPRLVARHADEDSAMHALDGIRAMVADLGEDKAMEMARTLETKSTLPEVKGRAKLVQASICTEGGKSTDPERAKAATEIYRDVLYTLPKTRAGLEAAGILIGPLEKRFYEAERRWVDALMSLQTAGRPPEEWPKNPIHDFAPEYQPIAEAEHHTAAKWVNRFYPAYEQTEKQGKPFAYQSFVDALGEYYADGVDGPWNVLRMDLLTVLYRQFPTEKWVYGSLKRLLPAAESVPCDHFEPALNALLEKNQDPRVRAIATFDLAQCAKMRGDQKGYARAIDLFTKVRDEYPESEVRVPADAGRADLSRSMPGQPAPSSPIADADGIKFQVADYKGRVVLLDFWTSKIPACAEAFPSRAALAAELAQKPFSLLGINLDNMKGPDFRAAAQKSGITWRTGLATFNHPVTEGWEVRIYPTTILIDKKGIIRARNLPWDEMTAMARKLSDESP
jgi:thiol-disulfide isomerase/thioredoxin